MTQLNPEEQNLPADASGQEDQSYLEDTKPRRVVPASEQQAQSAAGEAAGAAEGAPESAGDTRPVTAVTPQVESSAEGAAEGAAEPAEALEFEDAGRGFEHTIPPPPAALEPMLQAEPAAMEAVPAAKPGSAKTGKPARKKKAARGKGLRSMRGVLVPIIGLGVFVLVALIAGGAATAAALGDRRNAEATQKVEAADFQFQRGLQDFNDGNYFAARQRFEYVIQLNPGYPGAAEKLSETLLYLNATATPTLQPTATLTPTPDTRATDDLFNQAQQAVLNSQWDQAVEALLSLRQKDPNYRPVDIDDMLYLALRNRGREKIVQTDLEGGIYDLTLAKNFGPLDSEASGLLNWSQLYITGASFWEIDWAQVVDYFSQIAPSMPNLMDASKMTASERLRLGLFNYGNQKAQSGEWCDAVQLYQQSLTMAQTAEVQSAYEEAAAHCGGGGGGDNGTPQPTKKNKRTPTP